MSLDERKTNELNPLITNLLLPSASIDICSEDDITPNHLRNTSNAVSICQLSTPTYNDHDHLHEFQTMVACDTDADNHAYDISSSFMMMHEEYIENRKRSLNLNINNCNKKENRNSEIDSLSKRELLVLEESRSVYSASRCMHNGDNIGDLGNLSDFTDSTACYAPYRANEELQFVDVDDCDFMNDSNIDLLSHIRIDLPYAAMDLLRDDKHIEFEMIHTDFDDDKIDDDDVTYGAKHKRVSYFRPNTFDICLITSSPFCISKKTDLTKDEMEYLRHSLPKRFEIQDAVRDTLIDRECAIRYAHFNGTQSALNCIAAGGGCKILQFVGYCCNPARDSEEYAEICSCLNIRTDANDTDYILLQDDDNCGVGIWRTKEEFCEILNASTTKIDVIICISPQHKRMIEIFKSLGYEYIIGVELEAACDYRLFSGTESMTFLTHLYATLLDCTSVCHAFALSLQAALSFRGGSHTKISNCDSKYILNTKISNCERYVVFNNKINNDNNNKFIDLSKYAQLAPNNLREIIRPMIGRAQYISSLIHNMSLIDNIAIMNVSGREHIGKASVVKCALRYLLEMGLFRGGCFMIDCKAKKYQNMSSFDQVVMNVMQECGVYHEFALLEESFCFVILNVNYWQNGQHDIENWIDSHHKQLFENKDSRIVCTGNSALNIASMDTLNMRELSDLSPSELASLFQHFCGHILNASITREEIETNSELQELLRGSPGITQKVAQFAIFLAADEKNSFSLEHIVMQYRHKMKCGLKLSSAHAASEPFQTTRLKESQSLCFEARAYSAYPLIEFPVSRSLPNAADMSPINNIVINESNRIRKHIMNKSMEFAKGCVLDLNATEIWNKCATKTLDDLYPHLIEYFKQNTDENERIPTITDIESFFIRNGGYLDPVVPAAESGSARVYIAFNDFENRFFAWFSSMCEMIRDLHEIYETNTPLFYSRDLAKQTITNCGAGTFIVRFASQANGLALTYKKLNGKISNVLLKRLSHRIYRVGKTSKKADLCDLIESWSKLKYLYISYDVQICKESIPALKNNNKHNISCSLSMTQSTTQRSDDFYAYAAECDKTAEVGLKSQLDEIVMNFSDFTNHFDVNNNNNNNNNLQLKLSQENENLKHKMSKIEEENSKLKQLLSSHIAVYSPRASCSNMTPTTISMSTPKSACSTPCSNSSPFDIKPTASVYNYNIADKMVALTFKH